MEIWKGVTHASLTDSHLKDSATQLLIKYKSGALVTQFHVCEDDYDENVVDDENDGDGQMVVTIRIANIPMSLTHL